MNKQKFKSILALNGETQKSLAEYLKISETTLSLKISGRADFSRVEIKEIKEKFNLTANDLDEIFFNQ